MPEGGGSPVPGLVERLYGRLLGEERAERALADLEELESRLRNLYGSRYARARVRREAAGVLVWWAVSGVMERIVAMRKSLPMLLRGVMYTDFGRDLRFGVRSLLRRPGFAVLAVLILGLGIGANTSIFTLASRIFMTAPPSVASPESLIRVSRSWAPGEGGSVSYPDYAWYRDRAETVSGLMAYSPADIAVTAGVSGSATAARAWLVTDNYFSVLGLQPATGRFFLPEENRTPMTHPVAVVSWAYWDRVLGRDPAAVGSSVELNGSRFTIVGVTPRAFRGLSPAETLADFFLPVMMRPAVQPTRDAAWYRRLEDAVSNWLVVVGRLQPGVGTDAARSELIALHEGLKRQFPFVPQGYTVLVTSQYRYYPGTGRSLADMTSMLLAVVAAVLLIAAANVAVLLLTRAAVRAREMGVRSALGAGRGRVFRQMLAESLVLAGAGGVLGLLLALWGARAAAGLLPFPLDSTNPDPRVLAFAIGVTILTAVLVGVAPALQAARTDVMTLMRMQGGRSPRARVQDGLVVLQIGLSLVLVAGAVLFTRSLNAARTRDVGFDASNVLLLHLNVRNHGYDDERVRTFVPMVLDRLAALPGVAHASTTRMVPFQGDWTTTIQPPPGAAVSGGEDGVVVGMNVVMPEYFPAMGTPLVRGRGVEASDGPESEPVVVVNEALANAFWPGEEAVGRLFHLRGEDQPPYRVVGVAADATYYRLGEDQQFQAIGSEMQAAAPDITFVLRTTGEPLALARPAREVILAIDPNLAISRMGSLADLFEEEIGRFRIASRLVGLFGVLALVLASAGLYAAVSYLVARGSREIGIRMALGSTRALVARSVLRRGLSLVAVGVVLGLAGGLGLTQLVSRFVFGVEPRDPLTFLVAPAVLLAVAVLAVLVPARRAMAVDPMSAIRVD